MLNKERRYYNPFQANEPDLDKRYFIVSSTVAAVASLGATIGGALAMAGPLTFGTSLALGTAGVAAGGAAIYGVGKMIGSMTPDAPTYAPSVPSPIPAGSTLQAESEAAAKEKTLSTRRAAARSKTIYTDPLGLTPAAKAGSTSLKSLTGE